MSLTKAPEPPVRIGFAGTGAGVHAVAGVDAAAWADAASRADAGPAAQPGFHPAAAVGVTLADVRSGCVYQSLYGPDAASGSHAGASDRKRRAESVLIARVVAVVPATALRAPVRCLADTRSAASAIIVVRLCWHKMPKQSSTVGYHPLLWHTAPPLHRPIF